MNRESIIKEFEKEHGKRYDTADDAPDAFIEWLISKVIAQGDEIERLKRDLLDEVDIKESREDMLDNFVESLGGVNTHGEHSNHNNPWYNAVVYSATLQSAHDKLKQRIDDAPSDILVMDEFMAGIELCLATQALIKRTNLEGKTVALVELPEEMEEEEIVCRLSLQMSEKPLIKIVKCANCGADVEICPFPPFPLLVYCEEKACQEAWQKEIERRGRQPVDGNVFFEIKPDLGMYLFHELKWADEPIQVAIVELKGE